MLADGRSPDIELKSGKLSLSLSLFFFFFFHLSVYYLKKPRIHVPVMPGVLPYFGIRPMYTLYIDTFVYVYACVYV